MSLWIPITIAAAAMQTLRFVLQKQLSGSELSAAGATFARFLFAAPLACLAAAAALGIHGDALPRPGPGFWGFVLMGGIAQILATFLTVALFGMRNFAVGIAFTKTETVQVAAFSGLILGDRIPFWGYVAILIGLAGVLVLSRPAKAGDGPREGILNRGTVLGLLAGGLFGASAIGYRGATLEIARDDTALRAALALACVTAFQSIAMALWLAWREPGQVGRVLQAWRATALVGLTGVLGSFGWFVAFALQNAAYVRSVGQVELVFSLLASVLFFRERIRPAELAGIALIVVSIVMIVQQAG